MRQLDGRTAIVTGASSGIGRATALALAAEGAAVVVAGRTERALSGVEDEVRSRGARARAQLMDVRDERQFAALVDLALREFGRLDILVNNAGLSYPGNIQDGQTEEWREMLETNVLGLLIGCREAIRAMKANNPAGGDIVNVSSVAARHTGPEGQVYSATKHAVNAISDGLRQELQGSGIRVTVVMPGGTLTSFGRNLPQELLDGVARGLGVDPAAEGVRHGEHLPLAGIERVLRQHPGVFLSADDIARAVLFAVTQPAAIHVNEVMVQPSTGLNLGG